MASELNIEKDISLAPLTTLKIGGEARFFTRAENEGQVVEGLEFARQHSLPVFILGGGSNVLIADEGFDGLVLQMALKGISFEGNTAIAAAGEDWDKFVESCVERGLAGVECLSGIPGFVGATPIQNVGAYGQDVSETIVTVRVYDRENGVFQIMSNPDCGFAYRSSIFNTSEKGRYIVLGATYVFNENGAPNISYADLKKYFTGEDKTPSLSDVRRAVLAIRAKKSMVISADDPNSKSAGSFFKNPVVSEEKFREIQEAREKTGAEVPYFAIGEGEVKIPAAWLIEKSGFNKGYLYGSVGISQNHTLAIINRGGAKAREVLEFMKIIQQAVGERFGIAIKPEPVFIGFEK
jgi:UDP-N-acetylmuramate dehydrogenase